MKKELSIGNVIEHMSQSEKRYFKLQHQSSQRDKNYIKLFDLYEKMPNADNAAIKNKLKTVSSNLSQEKAYLQWQLLQALHRFHEQHSYNIQLHNVLCEIEVLYNKRLFDWCLKLIHQYKPVAENGEYLPQWLQLIEWQQRCLASAADTVYFKGAYKALFEEENIVLSKAIEIMDIKKEKTFILSYLFPEGYLKPADTAEFEKVVSKNEKRDVKKILSTRALLQHLELLCLAYQYQFNIKKSIQYCKKSLAVFEENQDIIAYHLAAYCATLGNYISLSIQQKNFDDALFYIEKYEEIDAQHKYKTPPHLSIEMRITTSVYKMIIYADLKNYDKGLEIVTQAQSIFFPLSKHKRKDGFIIYFYYAAIFQLFNNNASAALDNINTIIDNLNEQNRTDYYTCSMVMQLMAHYDLGNYRLLPSKTQSIKRFLHTRNITLKTPFLIIKYFEKLEKQLPSKHKNIFNNLAKEINKTQAKELEESYFASTLMILEWLNK